MSLQDNTYIICPDFGRREVGFRLGDIYAATKTEPRLIDHNTRLLLGSNALDLETRRSKTQTHDRFYYYDGAPHVGESHNGPNVAFRNGGLSNYMSAQTKERLLYIAAAEVKTCWFEPDREYIAEKLQHIKIKKGFMGLHTPPVFMITGIKIAHGAVSVNVELNSYEAGEMQGLGKPRAETKVPEDVWQDIASKVGDNPATLYLEHEAPFVMAIEARRIQVRKADFEDRVFDEYASISNDHGGNLSQTDRE